jgi:acetyl-CoA carboxylase biotin carboxylase subunit
MQITLKKCLIANRGEIALRIMRACRELGIATVAVYSDADARAQHTLFADEAYPIGPSAPQASYLNSHKLIETALTSGCDCIHPGYGFLSESPDFAQMVIDAGLVWVGPPPQAIALMGVKTGARARMEAAGVPLAPGFASETADDTAFIDAADSIGYPVMVKAAGGGGGKGIRIVQRPQDLEDALAGARREAEHAFNDPRIFLERYVEHARHIEVQVIADAHGSVLHLYERECSAQRRHQKIIEETPAPGLDEASRTAICEAAVRAAAAIGYVNAGTVEFIATQDGQFYFLEMNTRLQVEHPVTELVTGVDLVKLQFQVASGERLPFVQDDIRQQGHAIECRLYAEDPRSGFLPATGRVLSFVPPSGPGVRVDGGIVSGDSITIHYDPLIAKIIVHDRTRDGAIARMGRALRDTVVLGATTNIDFLLALVESDSFGAGEVHTGTVDAHLDAFLPESIPVPDAALIALALADMHNREDSVRNAASGAAGGDVFSPWTRSDGFRLGDTSR